MFTRSASPKRVLVVPLMLLFAGVAACGGAEGVSDGPTIELGTTATVSGASAIFAAEGGYWEEQGIDVDLKLFVAGKDARDGVLSGSLDAASVATAPFISGATQTEELVAIGSTGSVGRTTGLVVPRNSDISSIADLKGKDVAIQTGTEQDFMFRNVALPAFGLSADDVRLRNIPYAEHIGALTSGQVDAFVGFDPFIALAELRGAKKVTDLAEWSPSPILLVVRRELLEQEDVKEGLAVGLMNAMEDMQKDLPAAVDIVHEQFRKQGVEMDKSMLEEILGRVDLDPRITADIRKTLDLQVQILTDEGQIQRAPKWESVLDGGVMSDALTPYWDERSAIPNEK